MYRGYSRRFTSAIKALKLAGVIDINIPNNTTDITKIHWRGGKTYGSIEEPDR